MTSYKWILESVVHTIHEAQIAEHGGQSGIRDHALLESALERPKNLLHYGDPDVAALVASYAFGLSKNHPFFDGNKRTAFVVMELFLSLNGYELTADDQSCVLTMLDLAAGELSDEALAVWIKEHIEVRD